MSESFHNLNEAYQSIYNSQEPEQLDELVGAAIGAGLGYLGSKFGSGLVKGWRGDQGGAKPTPAKKPSPTPSTKPTPTAEKPAPSTKPTPTAEKPAPSTKPTPTTKPTTAAKPTTTPKPTPATKPAAKPEKPAGSAMDQWAKANPKLAAAKAERDRTRGTSATTNPLMKDMKDKLPAPKSPSPSTASTGFDLAKKGVNLAAGVDLFDIIKGHLLDEGYADSEEGAMVIMVNMSEEWRQSILESYGVQLDEISKELALKAHAERATNEFETDGDDPRDFTKSGKSKADESERRIVKKHGEGARREANRAAEKRIFGHNKYSEAQERENEKKEKAKNEGYAVTIEDIVKLLDENREHEREMRKAAARERAEEKRDRKEEGKKSAKAPGRLGKSAGSSYADYQEVSIKAHDKATKGKFIPGMVKNEGYQRDPEKGEKEDRKYEPVRGERTPMPPRGDKRREEFEKWYAKQMGR